MGFFGSRDNTLRLESPEDFKRAVNELQNKSLNQAQHIDQLTQALKRMANAIENMSSEINRLNQEIYNMQQTMQQSMRGAPNYGRPSYNAGYQQSRGMGFGEMVAADIVGDLAADVLEDIF